MNCDPGQLKSVSLWRQRVVIPASRKQTSGAGVPDVWLETLGAHRTQRRYLASHSRVVDDKYEYSFLAADNSSQKGWSNAIYDGGHADGGRGERRSL